MKILISKKALTVYISLAILVAAAFGKADVVCEKVDVILGVKPDICVEVLASE